MLFTDFLVCQYFGDHFGYNKLQLSAVLALHIVSCSLMSFTFEIKDKKEFIERCKNERLQNDLKLVLNQIPEGVIVCTKN